MQSNQQFPAVQATRASARLHDTARAGFHYDKMKTTTKQTTDYLDCLRLEHCNFNAPEWVFVSDSQDARAVKENLGSIADEFDSFFVKVGDGDYLEVWGIFGSVPYTHKNSYRIL